MYREIAHLKQRPRRTPALWEELERTSDHGTDAAKLAAFEKYFFNKRAPIAAWPTAPG